MYDLNRATLLGRLTRDPELRTTPSGKSVANIAIATSRSWLDAKGVKQEKTEFSNCVLWGKFADIAGQYMVKGKRVYVEGRLETRDWTGTDGVKRYRTEIIVENMILLDSPRGTAGGAGGSQASAPRQSPQMDEQLPTIQVPTETEEIKVEDIPF